MSDCYKYKPFTIHGTDRTYQLPMRRRRFGKKGRRSNKQDRAPRDYATWWWDQPRTGVLAYADAEYGE